MKKKPNTPRSRVKNSLRRLWLQSRERAAALKREAYSCEICKIKQSKVKGQEQKIEVHHIDGINWNKIVNMIFDRVLIPANKLKVLCPKCHKKEHKTE